MTDVTIPLELVIDMVRGQKYQDPSTNPDYDRGVEAAVRILEDMLPINPHALIRK